MSNPKNRHAAAIRAAALSEPADFVARYLIDAPPHAFGGSGDFEAFCREMSTKLDVPLESIAIVGSACLGFSLNKAHLLSPFSDESDIDVAVVSSPLFDSAWEELAIGADRFALTGDDERRRFRRTRDNLFFGYLRPDHLPLTLSLSRDWFPRLAGPYKTALAAAHPVKAWLFKSPVHMRLFYTRHIATIQGDIHRILELRGDLR